MSKNTTSITTNNQKDSNNTTASLSYNANTQNNQDFESINRALDQTKDNINKSIAESKSQIPQYNSIVNTYQEQTLQAAKEIAEHFIESQKAIINSIHSAWNPISQNYSTTINNWRISPESIANAYSRFINTVADNNVAVLKTANNLAYSSLDAFKTTVQHAKENTKQIIDINTKTAKTLEQNALAVQDSASKFNSSFINNQGHSSNISGTTSTSTSNTSTSAA